MSKYTKDTFGRVWVAVEEANKNSKLIRRQDMKSSISSKVLNLNHIRDFDKLKKLVDRLEKLYQ